MSDYPSEWRVTDLGAVVAEIVAGQSPNRMEHPARNGKKGILKTTAIQWNGFSPLENLEALPDFTANSNTIVRKNDILITKAGPSHRVGVVALSNEDTETLHVSGKMAAIRTSEEVDPKFLAYQMSQDAFQMQLRSDITGMALSQTNITHDNLLAKSIVVPPLPEQKKIAEILSGIDKAIDNQQNEIEKVSTIHRITCQEKIGELSQKSATTTIGSISNKIMDYRGKSPPKKDKGVPLITAKNIRKGFIDMNPAEFIQEDLYEEWMAKGVPVPGDILITTEAPLGNVAIAPPIKFAIGQRVICISPNRARIVPEFLLACMKTDDFQKQLTASSTGSTVSGVRQGVLLDCKIPLPDIELQIKIGNLDLCAIEMISILTLKKAKLSILKQSIASDLLSGRKRVSV